MENKGKHVKIKIPDENVWNNFLDHIKSIHGKTYGHIGIETQNALLYYIKCSSENDIEEICKKYKEKLQNLEDINLKLQNKINNRTEEKNQLYQDHRKLRNRYDHLQERFNKSQKDLNILERETRKLHVVIAKIEKLSFWERVLNRLPSEIKQLTTNEEDISSESNR